MKKTPLVLAALLLLSGCSAAKNLLDNPCSWNATGAETSSGTCSATGVFSSTKNESEIAIVGVANTTFYLDAAAASFTGSFADGTYTSSGTSSTNGGIVFQNPAVTSQWAAVYEATTSNQGSYTFTITSFSNGLVPGTLTIHGTATGTLTPTPTTNNGATGSVNISITF
jgi:hypothetical protein